MTTRLVITGGFLGAGKTTWLLKAAQTLTARGYRVGLITNDMGPNHRSFIMTPSSRSLVRPVPQP